MIALHPQSIASTVPSASKQPFLTVSSPSHEAANRLGHGAAPSVGTTTRGKRTPTELMVMRGSSKATGQRVWAVQSTSQSKEKGYPVFHILTWDAARAVWVCPCPARKPCVHMRLASEASQQEQQRVDAAFDALTAPTCKDCHARATHNCWKCDVPLCMACYERGGELCCSCLASVDDYDDSNPRRDELEVLMKAEPIIARHDTGPRLFRGPLSPVLAERVREVW